MLSPHTSRTDRIVKVREYAAVASIRRYVILESTSIGLTVLERGGPDEVWRVTTLTTDEILHMPEFDIEGPITEFYDGVDFPDEVAAQPKALASDSARSAISCLLCVLGDLCVDVAALITR